ncbi:hypothetical protein ABEO79_00250 [Micromonospora provocatoris]
MQSNEARQLCNNYRGQVVRIYDKSGNEHYGRISKVTDERVWIEPIDQHRQNSNYSNKRSSNSSNRNRNDSYRERSNRNYSNRDYSNRNNFNRDYSSSYYPRNQRYNNNFRERENYGCGFFGCGYGVSIAIGFIAGIALAALFFF